MSVFHDYSVFPANLMKKEDILYSSKNNLLVCICSLLTCKIVADDIEFGMGNKIPLWLFGFLY